MAKEEEQHDEDEKRNKFPTGHSDEEDDDKPLSDKFISDFNDLILVKPGPGYEAGPIANEDEEGAEEHEDGGE